MKTPKIVLALYFIIFIWSAINPVDKNVWYIEAITSFIPVLILFILYIKNIRLSNTAYVLMSIFPILHIIGAHYTFALVPFDWFSNLFGYERDMFDRVAHFSVGFYVFAIISLSAVYEIFEWQYAVLGDPNAGIAVLGSQGDVWDAQKDMLMDTLGAILVIIVYFFKSRELE